MPRSPWEDIKHCPYCGQEFSSTTSRKDELFSHLKASHQDIVAKSWKRDKIMAVATIVGVAIIVLLPLVLYPDSSSAHTFVIIVGAATAITVLNRLWKRRRQKA